MIPRLLIVDDEPAARRLAGRILRTRYNLLYAEDAAEARERLARNPFELLLCDINLPGESAIFRSHWGQFTDAFSSAGLGLGHTKFTRWHGVRIDHILAGPGWRFRRCWVGPDVKSDHRPLIADVEWIGASE